MRQEWPTWSSSPARFFSVMSCYLSWLALEMSFSLDGLTWTFVSPHSHLLFYFLFSQRFFICVLFLFRFLPSCLHNFFQNVAVYTAKNAHNDFTQSTFYGKSLQEEKPKAKSAKESCNDGWLVNHSSPSIIIWLSITNEPLAHCQWTTSSSLEEPYEPLVHHQLAIVNRHQWTVHQNPLIFCFLWLLSWGQLQRPPSEVPSVAFWRKTFIYNDVCADENTY